MNRPRIHRLIVVTAAAVLMLAALGVGPVAARNPDWDVDAIPLPAAVSPGNDAGWAVTVRNDGPSQINDLNATITSDNGETPSFMGPITLSSGETATCSDATGDLVCSLGTFADDATATFTVAFGVPDGQVGDFRLYVALLSGTGDTGSDGGGNSRGDDQTFEFPVGVSQSTNHDAGFVVDDFTYETSGNLGRRNRQNSSAQVTEGGLPVTVQDSPLVTPQCTIDDCAGAFGDWTGIDVPSHDGLIKVTLFVWGGAVPGGVSAGEIYVLHDPDGPTAAYVIDTACDPATGTPTNAECLTATKVGGNWRIVVWLEDNGSLRGGF